MMRQIWRINHTDAAQLDEQRVEIVDKDFPTPQDPDD
jgi:hypothetical protein